MTLRTALGPLRDGIAALAPQNVQGEYYLPDLIGIYRRRGLGVSTLTVRSANEIRGVNSRRELVSDEYFGVYAPRLGAPIRPDGFFGS